MASDSDEKSAKALKRCNDLITWYEIHKPKQRLAFQIGQTVAIVCGGLTPILILWDGLPRVLVALPASLAVIATSLISVFQWKENYLRFSVTLEMLLNEKMKFETRTGKDYRSSLSDEEAVGNFIENVEFLALSEVNEWRGLMRKSANISASSSNNEANPVTK